MLKREWGAERNGKLPHLFIPSKTATWVCNGRPAFGRICSLGSWVCSEAPAVGQNTHDIYMGRRVIGISGSLIWSKTLMELLFNPCGEFRWSPEDPISQIHSPHLNAGAPAIFSDLLSSVQMLKREWCAEGNGKPPLLFIPSYTATLVPAFAVEDLPFSRTTTWVPAFAVKDLSLGRTLCWWWWYIIIRDPQILQLAKSQKI